jgi:hypothetical protein
LRFSVKIFGLFALVGGPKKVFLRDPDPLFGGRVYVIDEDNKKLM